MKLNHILLMLALSVTSTLYAAPPKSFASNKLKQQYEQLKEKTQKGNIVRVIAKLTEDLTSGAIKGSKLKNIRHAKQKLSLAGLTSQRTLDRIGAVVLEVNQSELDDLITSGVVETIEEDVLYAPHLIESIDHIEADLTIGQGFTGNGQAVVIIDTGVESWHPFYTNRLVEEACFSSNTTIATSLCPNGQNQQIGVNAANDCSPTGIGGCDHGTHVAGIAAGQNAQMSGVAPEADIVAVQVFSRRICDNGLPCIRAYTSDMLAALEWVLNDATTQNIAAVNMSMGTITSNQACPSHALAETIQQLRDEGIATVISSGNEGHIDGVGSPGCIPAAVTVGNTLDQFDIIRTSSNSSNSVDLLAPGTGITSSVTGGQYNMKSGTSMAAPHVAGAFAVLKSIEPTASIDYLEAIMESTGETILDTRNNLSFPRLNLLAAVNQLSNAPPLMLSVDQSNRGFVNATLHTSQSDNVMFAHDRARYGNTQDITWLAANDSGIELQYLLQVGTGDPSNNSNQTWKTYRSYTANQNSGEIAVVPNEISHYSQRHLFPYQSYPTTDGKYVYVHYRVRTVSNNGNSSWYYIAPIRVYDSNNEPDDKVFVRDTDGIAGNQNNELRYNGHMLGYVGTSTAYRASTALRFCQYKGFRTNKYGESLTATNIGGSSYAYHKGAGYSWTISGSYPIYAIDRVTCTN